MIRTVALLRELREDYERVYHHSSRAIAFAQSIQRPVAEEDEPALGGPGGASLTV